MSWIHQNCKAKYPKASITQIFHIAQCTCTHTHSCNRDYVLWILSVFKQGTGNYAENVCRHREQLRCKNDWNEFATQLKVCYVLQGCVQHWKRKSVKIEYQIVHGQKCGIYEQNWKSKRTYARFKRNVIWFSCSTIHEMRTQEATQIKYDNGNDNDAQRMATTM